MEKICTRCNFRNPAARKVCQVCGFSKFAAMGDATVVIAKRSEDATTDSLRSFFAALLRKFSALFEKRQSTESTLIVETRREPRLVSRETATVNFDSNDLDAMIAWFKSYGVNQPLILERKTIPVRDDSKAA